MKIISLSSNIAGPACAVAQCIKKYYNNDYKTNFFDFLEVNFTSIIQFLKIENIDKELKTNNYIISNKIGKKSVYFNNFNKMISHHDLEENYKKEDYDIFIEKYKRRYYRLLDTIKEENKIFFIRYGLENEELINNFINEVSKINPKLKIYFINVEYDSNNLNICYNNKNYKYINFYNYMDYNLKYDDDLYFKTLQFNWNVVFEIINNLDK